MGSEIVLGRPDCDPTSFEQAVRTKLNQFSSPTRNKEAVELGISFAQSLVDQVLSQIRAQAQVKQKLKAASGTTRIGSIAQRFELRCDTDGVHCENMPSERLATSPRASEYRCCTGH